MIEMGKHKRNGNIRFLMDEWILGRFQAGKETLSENFKRDRLNANRNLQLLHPNQTTKIPDYLFSSICFSYLKFIF